MTWLEIHSTLNLITILFMYLLIFIPTLGLAEPFRAPATNPGPGKRILLPPLVVPDVDRKQ